MSLQKDASGRRYVQVETEVPGTPEQVWQAIATGPGVSSWFVPTEDREDGTTVSHFGPGMDSVAKRTAWDPPHRFAAESAGLGPDAPPMATEWTVEARSGGTCIVRVVHSLFASTDDWDDQLTSIESGWPTFFEILRRYLENFQGQPCTSFQLMAMAPGPLEKAWESLMQSFGLCGIAKGEAWNGAGGAPATTGKVDEIGHGAHPHELLRLDVPAPGLASLSACGMGGQVYLSVSFYLYGKDAAATVERVSPQWEAWMAQKFPHAG